MVFGVARLLDSSPAATDNPTAQPAAATVGSPTTGETSAAPTSTPQAQASGETAKKGKKNRPTRTKTPLAVPTGPCADSDVKVSPSVEGDPIAGLDVTFALTLTTLESPACTWTVSPDTVVLKLTSGSDRIWSTQDCPAAVGRQDVVVRKDHATTVRVTWSGQRSDVDCSRTTQWAQPGYYFATAAALGAEPESRQFQLLSPPRPTITPTPTVKPKKGKRD
jgi:hypothetical protein